MVFDKRNSPRILLLCIFLQPTFRSVISDVKYVALEFLDRLKFE